MSSSLGEQVSFTDQVPLMGIPELAEGESQTKDAQTERLRPVEAWLQQVEAGMRGSLRVHVEEARDAASSQERREWLFGWSAQIVLALDQCRWTKTVEEEGLVLSPGNESLKVVLKQEEARLSELVALTRSLSREEVRHVETLGALIVLGVHSKDVTAELLSS